MRFKVIQTKYWRPGEDYLKSIFENTSRFLKDGDIIVISEKALSVAQGNIIDESKVMPGLLARAIAALYMRLFWGCFLGQVCHFKPETIARLRSYPRKEGAAHKQAVLRLAGFMQALKYGSEGSIDTSNVPYSYACLPLENPREVAENIEKTLEKRIGKNVTVIISDTDSTFSIRNFHFTSRPNPIEGIKSCGGAFSFIAGRALKLKQRATPLAVAGTDAKIGVEEALSIVEVAHHARGYGAGRTVWDMRKKFGVGFSEVTWEMLEKANHFPIVLIRRTGSKNN